MGLDGGGMAQQDGQGKRRRSGLKVFLVVLLAAVVALGVLAAMLYGSCQRIMAAAEQISEDGPSVEEALDNYDGNALYDRLSSIDASVDVIAGELAGPAWGVAACVPVVGSDVTGVRQLAGIAQDVMSTTVMPFAGVARSASQVALRTLGTGVVDMLSGGAAGGLGMSGVREMAQALSQIDGSLDTLRASQASLEADAQALSEIGEFHFDVLDEARDMLADAIDELSEVMDQVEPALEGYAQTKEAVSGAADAATHAADQVADVAGQAIDAAAQVGGQVVQGAKDLGAAAKGFAEGALSGLFS